MPAPTSSLRNVTIATLIACAMNAVVGGFWLVVSFHDNLLHPPEESWIGNMSNSARGWLNFSTNLFQVFFGVCLTTFFYVLWKKQRS